MKVYEDELHIEGGEIIRQIVFGMNDGIVSIFALLAGVAGAGQDAQTILITLLAATIAGALSMAAGEYISAKSEHEYFKNEIEKERLETYLVPEIEQEEVEMIYRKKGFDDKMAKEITKVIIQDRELWVREMVIDELGTSELEQASGLKTSVIIFIAFILGSAFPVLPYLIFAGVSTVSPLALFWGATFVTFFGLFLAGALKKYVTGSIWWKSGLEMLAVGLFAFGVSFLIGQWVGVSV